MPVFFLSFFLSFVLSLSLSLSAFRYLIIQIAPFRRRRRVARSVGDARYFYIRRFVRGFKTAGGHLDTTTPTPPLATPPWPRPLPSRRAGGSASGWNAGRISFCFCWFLYFLFLPGFTGFYWVLLGFNGFLLVETGFTWFYWVLLALKGFTGF